MTLWLPTQAYSQSQPGQFLVSPRHDIIFDCNVDGSNCFHVTGASQAAGDPGGGDQMISSASQPSVANNGIVAFTALYGVDGTCAPGAQGICQSHVFLMNADGSNVRQITFNPGSASQFGGDNYAAISPDGTKVAFISNRNIAAYDSNNNPIYKFAVFVVNADGSDLHQVTPFTYDASGNPHGDMYSVAWSPDSRRLAFKGSQYGTICGTSFGSPIDFLAVGTINVEGTGETYLACDSINAAGGAVAIDWSPDGTLIADARNSVGFGEPAVRITDLSGQNRYSGGLLLAQLGVQYSGGSYSGEFCATDRHCFHFSPDSTKLAYENNGPSDNPTFYGISTIKLDGTGRLDRVPFGTAYDVFGVTYGMWWDAGPALPEAAQLSLAPTTVEVWPGYSQQLTPSLLDAGSNLILHTASAYSISSVSNPTCSIQIGPYGLAMYGSVNPSGLNSPSISAANEAFTSNSALLKCWTSPPCTYTLSSSSMNVGSGGGQNMVGVTADSGSNSSTCPWNAVSNASWITIASFAGSGNGSVSFVVAPNIGAARQGIVTIAGATFTVLQAPPPPRPFWDTDGDGKSDVSVWRPNNGEWFVLPSKSPGTYTGTQWGLSNDKPVPGDYDGDAKSDIAVWRPSTGVWYILPSSTPGQYISVQWGLPSDIPVPGDYDGDGKDDIVVWRPSTGVWYVLPSGTPGTYITTQWGANTDIPVPDNYDADTKTDIAVYRPSTGVWYILTSSTPGTYMATLWGSAGDEPVPGDYDGDGKSDIAVWRPGNGVWYILPSNSSGTYTATQWGLSSDIPISGDYDGDGKSDIGVWRPSTGIWYALPSGAPGTYTATQWGVSTDVRISGLTELLH